MFMNNYFYYLFQAQAKELDTDYNRLRQQYARLSSEHTTLNNQQKRNFQLYKEQKANEIASLDGKNASIFTVKECSALGVKLN